jgi:hypothetical protein
MTLYLHQRERTTPHTQSGYGLPEIKLRMSKLSWVTLKLSLGSLQSSTAPCRQPYKTLLILVPRILKNHALLFYSYILATVRIDVTQLPPPRFEKCDQLSHLFPELSVKTKPWHHEPSSLPSDRNHGAISIVLVTLLFYPGNALSIHLYPRENIGEKDFLP